MSLFVINYNVMLKNKLLLLVELEKTYNQLTPGTSCNIMSVP